MTAPQPWGRTGRVTLHTAADSRYHSVWVDGEDAGYTRASVDGTWCAHGWPLCDGPFPSLDHAVMQVLRRTAPDVWRAERPVVYSVARAVYRPGEVGWWGWWAWRGRNFDKADDVVPMVLGTFSDAVYVADFNARSLYGVGVR